MAEVLPKLFNDSKAFKNFQNYLIIFCPEDLLFLLFCTKFISFFNIFRTIWNVSKNERSLTFVQWYVLWNPWHDLIKNWFLFHFFITDLPDMLIQVAWITNDRLRNITNCSIGKKKNQRAEIWQTWKLSNSIRENEVSAWNL
jgi:hypothetical protein